jgi:hypothetical protein
LLELLCRARRRAEVAAEAEAAARRAELGEREALARAGSARAAPEGWLPAAELAAGAGHAARELAALARLRAAAATAGAGAARARALREAAEAVRARRREGERREAGRRAEAAADEAALGRWWASAAARSGRR